MYYYGTKKSSKNEGETSGADTTTPQNPFAPNIKPSDIIEKSTKTSGDWLTRGIDKKTKEKENPDGSKKEKNE